MIFKNCAPVGLHDKITKHNLGGCIKFKPTAQERWTV